MKQHFQHFGFFLFFAIASCSTPINKSNEPIPKKLTMKVQNNNQSKPKVIYYFDALCGWCYGFSPVMTQVHDLYSDKLDFEVVSGGLFLGNRIGYINDIAPYIKSGAYKTVESRTGIKFGKDFLDELLGDGKIELNSIPPATALCIVKETSPEQAIEFAETLLHAVYFDGLNPTDIDGLTQYATKLGLDEADFKSKMKQPKYAAAAQSDFEKFQASGFSGMPGVVLEQDGKRTVLSNGFVDFDELKSKIEAHLN